MRCAICKKTEDEIELSKGLFNSEMIMVCDECAKEEGVPIIKRPSQEQIDKGNEHHTVRERMERLSGMRDTTEISKDQTVVQGNLAKLKIPEKKQLHDDIFDDYYWKLNMARRRKKLSIKQLAEQMKIDPLDIENVEKGKIPGDFKDLFTRFEVFLGIKLLKGEAKKSIKFVRTQNEEQEILNSVKQKMGNSTPEEEILKEVVTKKEKQEMREKISRGEVDFSKKDAIQDVTLNDLVEIKRKKEKNKKRDEMLGDDLELDIDEL